MTHPAVFDAEQIKRILDEDHLVAVKGEVKMFIREGLRDQYVGFGYEVRAPLPGELDEQDAAADAYARRMSATPVRD